MGLILASLACSGLLDSVPDGASLPEDQTWRCDNMGWGFRCKTLEHGEDYALVWIREQEPISKDMRMSTRRYASAQAPFEGVFLDLGVRFNRVGLYASLGDGQWLDLFVRGPDRDDDPKTEQLARAWLPQVRIPELEAFCQRETGAPCPPLQIPELKPGTPP